MKTAWFPKWLTHTFARPAAENSSQQTPDTAQPLAHQPFRMEPLPEEWSLEWERRQLEKLRDFNLIRLTNEEMKGWQETLRCRKAALVQSQPPLVREMLVRHLEAGHGLECVHDPDELNEAWNFCDMRHKPEYILEDGRIADFWQEILDERYASLSEEEKALAEELEAHWAEWYPAWTAARACILNMERDTEQQLKRRWEQELEQFREDYGNHLKTLPADVLPLVGYEMARAGLSRGHSGFHGLGADPMLPFGACGWADYEAPHWPDAQGVAFRINRRCFGGQDVQLYYFDDDHFPTDGDAEWILATIRQCSSGIACVRVDSVVDEKGFAHRAILFRLDAAAIRDSVRLSGRDVDTKELGGYVFVLPRAGEFFCELGQVSEGRTIPLHKDDFCMK